MKFGPVNKSNKKNKATLKKLDNDVVSENCDFIVIFVIYGEFRTIQNGDVPDGESLKLIIS